MKKGGSGVWGRCRCRRTPTVSGCRYQDDDHLYPVRSRSNRLDTPLAGDDPGGSPARIARGPLMTQMRRTVARRRRSRPRPFLPPAGAARAEADTRSTPSTAPLARAWWTSAAGTCRSTTARRSTSITRCAPTPGMFDVSHMRVVDVEGAARPRRSCATSLANNVDKLKRCRQGAVLVPPHSPTAPMLDDLIVYLPDRERLSSGSSSMRRHCGQGHRAWLRERIAERAPASRSRRGPDLAIIAVQGPECAARTAEGASRQRAVPLRRSSPFNATLERSPCGEVMIARTG